MVRVELPPAVIEVGKSVADRPPAGAELDSTIVPGPPITAVLIELVVMEPWTMLSALGLAEIVKSRGPAATVTVTDVLCIAPEASVPVTVATYVPGTVVKSGETRSVEAPPDVITAGLRPGASPPGDEPSPRLIAFPVIPAFIPLPIALVPQLPSSTVL